MKVDMALGKTVLLGHFSAPRLAMQH